MDLSELKNKLSNYSKKDILITNHAEIQAIFREIEPEEVKQNILNPKRLVHIIRQESKSNKEEKYDCYFEYSNNLCPRYVLTINGKIIIVIHNFINDARLS